MPIKLEDLTWMEFEKLVPKKINTVILPIGTIEAHGVTSLATDVKIPQKISELIADDLEAIIAPPIYYGITRTLYAYPGSLTVNSETFKSYISEIMESLAEKGFLKIVVINGHGGHFDELKNAAMRAHRNKGAKPVVIHWWVLCQDIVKKVYGVQGGHAGIDETAGVLAIGKNLAKKKDYKKQMAFLYQDGVYALPCPGSIILYKEGEGYPDFDPQKAQRFMKEVSQKIKDTVLEIFKKWEENRV